jgi:hypothetical protein
LNLSHLTPGIEPPPEAPQAIAARPATAIAMPPPLPPEAFYSQNYFARHWRGDLSLPVSYWLNGIVAGLSTGVGVGVLLYFTNHDSEARPWLWLLSLVAVWIVAVLMMIWQSVGVWRSATRYRQGGRRFWGLAAKIMMVLGAGRLVYSFATAGFPQMAGFYEIITGDARVGKHEFHVLSNGTMLEFSGGITFGVAQEMEHFLDAMAGVRTVQLSSVGGRLLEAQKMSDLIKSRNLMTFVAKDCLSACTIVFLGGKDRVKLPAARLGFHQPTFRGMTAIARFATINTEEQRLQKFGLSKAFAQRANAAAPGSMWYPDNDELLREHVITRLFTPPKPAPLAPTRPAPSAAPSSADVGVTDKFSVIVPAPDAAREAGAAASTPTPPASFDLSRYETGRTRLPVELVKRLSTPPRKPLPVLVTPPSAATAAPSTAAVK